MLNDFVLSKGYNGYVIKNNRKITEAGFKDLETDGDLREKVVKLIFEANTNLRENISQINQALPKPYKSYPMLQVEQKGTDIFNVLCRIGSSGKEYAGTAISITDIQENPSIAIKFIELLVEDHFQLKSLINALSELEENMLSPFLEK